MTAVETAPPAAATAGEASAWPARRVFEELRGLGMLRVISVSGPSVFEAICSLDAFGVADGWLNAVTPAYHWHLDLAGLRHVTSRDAVHERSGRRVLFLELREAAGSPPFLLVYLHRGKGEELGTEREERFAALHEVFADGAWLAEEGA